MFLLGASVTTFNGILRRFEETDKLNDIGGIHSTKGPVAITRDGDATVGVDHKFRRLDELSALVPPGTDS